MSEPEDRLRLFCSNNLFINESLRQVEKDHQIELLPKAIAPEDRELASVYEQFEQRFRLQAKRMADCYEIFFCLENSIRELIESVLNDKLKEDWWKSAVPPDVQKTAEQNKSNERKMGFTPRSIREIDYINFGELAQIIAANRAIFGSIFTEVRTAENILVSLNQMRAPIAHCSYLSEDEIKILEVALADWFRQMQ